MREQLKAARDDLGVFAELVGRPLTPWQLEALRLEQRVTAVVGGRQLGKSRCLTVVGLHRAFRRPNQRVLIVCPGEESGKRQLADVRQVASTALLAGSVVDEQASLVRLSNGSEIRCVPASEKQIRGQSNDLVLVDEAAYITDDLLLGAAFPTTAARPDARIVLMSSPNGTEGAFFDYFTRGVNG